ncbi:MAG: sce7726 family protein [Candidatus Cloacimonetes bacterium]|nr:sce7726 family protein [Candidatus Cloacimonadota bacterium]
MTNLYDLQKLFSEEVLINLAEGIEDKLVQKSYLNYNMNSFSKLYDFVFSEFSKKYRNDLFYRNLIATKIFLSRHSLDKSVLINELRIGKSKADLVILNGSSTAYEIKSDVDNLDKLDKQLQDYLRVFDFTYVVIAEENATKLVSILPAKVGLISLTPKNTFKTIIKATSNKDYVDPDTIFRSLRINEYKSIIKKEFKFIPDVPNTRIFFECNKLFCELSPQTAHNEFVKVIKKRIKYSSSLKENVKKYPISLRHNILRSDFNDSQIANLLRQLEKERSTNVFPVSKRQTI